MTQVCCSTTLIHLKLAEYIWLTELDFSSVSDEESESHQLSGLHDSSGPIYKLTQHTTQFSIIKYLLFCQHSFRSTLRCHNKMLIVLQTLFNPPKKIIWLTLEALCHVPHTGVWSSHKLSCIVGKLQSFFWWHRTDHCLEKKVTSIMLKQRDDIPYCLYCTYIYKYIYIYICIYIFISLEKPMRLAFYKIHLSSCFGFVCFGYKRRQLCMNKNPFYLSFIKYQVPVYMIRVK